ncbi:MAG TPA: heptaprenyl diphosphate synthase [Firmicutes bacterium]|nr:heptaprenyl diphosphate synthase [Bacillota bacterium]
MSNKARGKLQELALKTSDKQQATSNKQRGVPLNKKRKISNQERIRMITKTGIYIALGVTLSLLETYLIPLGLVLPIPGAKIGLANLVTLVVLLTEKNQMVWLVTGGRIFLASLLTGTLFSVSFALSVGGSIAALLVMSILRKKTPKLFSLIGLSIAGAVAHNSGQLLTLYLLLPGAGVFSFLPWALLLAIPSGWLTGYLAIQIIQSLRREGGNEHGGA